MAALTKAYICPYRKGKPIYDKKYTVQFNPAELSIEEAVGVSEDAADSQLGELKKLLEGSRVGWSHPMESTSARKRTSSLTLSVTLFFNTLESLHQSSYEDVRDKITPLYLYTNRNAADNGPIEQIYFFWGSIGVAGTLNRMHVNYTMFAPNGKPVRAQVELSIVGGYYGDAGSSAQQESAGYDDRSYAKWREWWKGKGNPRQSLS